MTPLVQNEAHESGLVTCVGPGKMYTQKKWIGPNYDSSRNTNICP